LLPKHTPKAPEIAVDSCPANPDNRTVARFSRRSHQQTSETDARTEQSSSAYRICPFCEACCGLRVDVEQQRVVRIHGDQRDVFAAGFLCPKAVGLKDLHDDPDRLRTPHIKRDGRFVDASWDEAYAEIERRLPPVIAAGGPNAVATVLGNPSAHKMSLMLYFPRLARALGTRNMFSASSVDQVPKMLSVGLMFGTWLSVPVPDIERCEFLLILGANPMVSNGSLWTVPDFRGKAKALRARGGKIVVIDPRRTETADIADAHHFIRPGSDVFFLLGIAHALFDEKLVRLGRLAEHVSGFERLEPAFAPYSPERVAERCAIPAYVMRDLARTLSSTERAAVYGRIGTCTQQFGTLASWLIDVINVLTGHLDQEGGAMFSKAAAFAANTRGKPGSGRGVITGRYASRVSSAPEVGGELPLTCLAEEIDTPGTGQVKALIAIAANPVLSAPNGPRLAAALEGRTGKDVGTLVFTRTPRGLTPRGQTLSSNVCVNVKTRAFTGSGRRSIRGRSPGSAPSGPACGRPSP
jgi:anaerobic selenocysteine-containing dehydrogenase